MLALNSKYRKQLVLKRKKIFHQYLQTIVFKAQNFIACSLSVRNRNQFSQKNQVVEFAAMCMANAAIAVSFSKLINAPWRTPGSPACIKFGT